VKIDRIDHITIFVRDLAKAIGLFSDVMGIEFSQSWDNKNFDIKQTVGPLPSCINLCAPLTPGGNAERLLEQKGEGVSMISFKVPDLDAAITEMKAKGIRQIGGEQIGDARTATFHPKDTFGVMIELIEYREQHPLVTAFGE